MNTSRNTKKTERNKKTFKIAIRARRCRRRRRDRKQHRDQNGLREQAQPSHTPTNHREPSGSSSTRAYPDGGSRARRRGLRYHSRRRRDGMRSRPTMTAKLRRLSMMTMMMTGLLFMVLSVTVMLTRQRPRGLRHAAVHGRPFASRRGVGEGRRLGSPPRTRRAQRGTHGERRKRRLGPVARARAAGTFAARRRRRV